MRQTDRLASDPVMPAGEPEPRDVEEPASACVALAPFGADRRTVSEAPPSSVHNESDPHNFRPVSRMIPRRPHIDAPFLAQLIATHDGLQQTRARGRAEPEAGADAYEGRPVPPRGRLSTYI